MKYNWILIFWQTLFVVSLGLYTDSFLMVLTSAAGTGFIVALIEHYGLRSK